MFPMALSLGRPAGRPVANLKNTHFQQLTRFASAIMALVVTLTSLNLGQVARQTRTLPYSERMCDTLTHMMLRRSAGDY